MISEIVRIISFLLPVPFMLLFCIKTNKLNSVKNYIILTFLIPVFLQILSVNNIGYKIELIIVYMTFVIFGTFFFNKRGWTFLQSLSLSFCLVYFGSFLWELPYHIYTIIVRGGIDGAFPLHLLFIFPIVFIYEKVRTNQTIKKNLSIFCVILSFSLLVMLSLISNNYNIWHVPSNSLSEQIIEETVWMIARIVTISGLFIMYSKSTLRKGEKT